MSEDEWAHIVLLAALSFTDDTALLKKSIVPELLVGGSSYLPFQATIPDLVWTHHRCLMHTSVCSVARTVLRRTTEEW